MDRIGQQLGSYRIVSLIGQGGFADVYLGEHLHLGTRAAIKVLQMHLVGSNLDQFRQEARTIASLVHPHIVRVLDFGIENDIPFLIMDYAENGTIRQHLPTSEPIAPAKLTPYVNQIAEGLQYAHDKKFIHRDIKPDNILLDAKNNILLSDFGLVLSASSSSSQNLKEMAGTVSYMAPEQLQGKPRPASDQYSLGIVVYQWLSGNLPFNGSFTAIASQHLLAPPPPLREKIPCITHELEQVVLTALAKDPHQRFATVTAFAEALEKASLASISAVELTTKPLEQNPQKTAISVNAETVIASTAEITRPPEQPEETEIAPTDRASSDDNAPILEQPESATSTNEDTDSDKLATLPEPDQPKTESEIVDEHATLLDEEATLLVAASEDTEESTDTEVAASAPTEMASELASTEDHAAEPENRTEEAEDKPEQQPTELLPAPQQAEVDPTEGPTITQAEAPALNAVTDTVNTPAKRQEPASEASPDQSQPAHRENTTENTNEGESPTALIPTPEASSPTELITSAVARNKHSQATHRHRLPAGQPIQEVSITQPVISIQSPTRLPAPQIYYGLPGTPAQPRRRKQRDYRALIIILLLLITLVSAGTGVIYFAPGTARAFIQFARNTFMPKGPAPTAGPGRQVTTIASTPVAITLTEDKENFKDTFRILAITGTPDSAKNQVSARILTATSPIQSQTVKISNPTSISATRATGNLSLTNTSASTIQLAAKTTFTSTSGVTIALDSAASIPASQTLTVIAHATAPGAAGNIVALDLNTCLSSGNVPPTPTPTPTVPPGGCTAGTVQNNAAFSGGQDAHNANVVQQSDIDSATQKLSDALTSNTQQQLQAQVQTDEQTAGSPVCAPKVTPDHAVGDQADNLTVTGTLICTTEVFNSNAAQALAAQDLKDQIASNGKSNGYERTSNVSANVISVSTPDSSNTIKLDIIASGEWIYQLSDTQKQDLLHQIAGKSRQEAQNILLTQNGITSAVLPPEVQTLPSDPHKISFIVQ